LIGAAVVAAMIGEPAATRPTRRIEALRNVRGIRRTADW
jgi:hypothetical protein